MFLGLTAPIDVGSNWAAYIGWEARGHAYAASNFPAPGDVWNDLAMGSTIPLLPGAPGNLVAIGELGQNYLTWDAAPSPTPITSYLVFGGWSEQHFLDRPIATLSGDYLAFADLSVEAGMTYYYLVKAVNADGTGPASRTANATPTATTPGQPRGVIATSGYGSVTITWSAPNSTGASHITSYKIYRQLDKESLLLGTLGSSATDFEDSTGTPGVTYSYCVVAVNAIGSGPASAMVSAAPLSSPSSQDTILIVGVAIAIIVVIAIVYIQMRRKKGA
jgi:hypothetical protein